MFSRPIQILALGGALLAVTACDPMNTEPESTEAIPGTPPALAAAPNTWLTRTAMPGTERWGHTSAVVSNSAGQPILYVIGGSGHPSGPALATVQAFDFAVNTWSTKAPMPLALFQTNGAGVIDGKIYVSGGVEMGDKQYRQTLFVYDPAANTWSRKRDMPTETWGGVTGVIDGKLYVLTCDVEDDCYAFTRMALYRYDPATDQWTLLSVTPRALGDPMGGVIGGKLYATGGPSGELVVYDPVTNTWTQKASLPVGRAWGAAAVIAGKLFILGGFERLADGSHIEVRKTTMYIPAKDLWREKAPMPTHRLHFAAAKAVVNGQARIVAVGGPRPGNHLQYVP